MKEEMSKRGSNKREECLKEAMVMVRTGIIFVYVSMENEYNGLVGCGLSSEEEKEAIYSVLWCGKVLREACLVGK